MVRQRYSLRASLQPPTTMHGSSVYTSMRTSSFENTPLCEAGEQCRETPSTERGIARSLHVSQKRMILSTQLACEPFAFLLGERQQPECVSKIQHTQSSLSTPGKRFECVPGSVHKLGKSDTLTFGCCSGDARGLCIQDQSFLDFSAPDLCDDAKLARTGSSPRNARSSEQDSNCLIQPRSTRRSSSASTEACPWNSLRVKTNHLHTFRTRLFSERCRSLQGAASNLSEHRQQ